MRATLLKVHGAKMCALASSDTLVQAFEMTDAVMPGLSTDDYLAVCEVRGWILDEMVKRGEGALVGLYDPEVSAGREP